ncbi:MAG: glycoside hydrolase family 31 protein [Chthoniobacteraceae bacterium]
MMLFGQKLHPRNFEHGSRLSRRNGSIEVTARTFKVRITCDEITPACTRLRFDNSNVADKRNYSDGVVENLRAGKSVPVGKGTPTFSTSACDIEVGASRLGIRLKNGMVLETAEDGFGFNGAQSLFNFSVPDASGFYGFGERTKRFNKTGDSLDFYNVDVCAVFPHTFQRDDYDPAYVAIPFAIVRTGAGYVGLYLDNPERLVFDVGHIQPGHLMLQSLAGNNDLYILSGPTLRDVVRNFATLTGRADVPPLWSLGYHQCRWGYKTAAEFRALRENFEKFDIPVSALWFDIDYMDEYRVFTWDRVDLPDPAKLNRELKSAGIRAVTIVDPGVKLEQGYPIYESGTKSGIFCKTASGRDYVGRVWPGDTVFPDFATKAARDWWAGHFAKFIKDAALDGVWLDMNDPATGWSATEDMRFECGTVAHGAYHNQYGHLMAKASWQALRKLDRNARPFLLTRSGFAGTQRYSAIWTGDNVSNWEHLRMSIPCTINLGLSGVAFNGPDVGGFCGHTDEELITRWYQAGFLFPFFRNHTTAHTKEQEPWNFGPQCLARIRDAIHTRYRLMPYLYNCFFAHHLTGDPVLRPLLYDFDSPAFENLDDEFMVGDSILMAPIVERADAGRSVVMHGVRRQQRHVALPDGWWFDLRAGEWIPGGRTILCSACLDEVPIFIRDGSIIPYFNGKFRNGDMTLTKIELHTFIKERDAQLDYYIEDQKTRQYLKGSYNTARIRAGNADGETRIVIDEEGRYATGTVEFAPVIYGSEPSRAVLEHNGVRRSRRLQNSTRRWVSTDVSVQA